MNRAPRRADAGTISALSRGLALAFCLTLLQGCLTVFGGMGGYVPGLTDGELTQNGRTRGYKIYLPPGARRSRDPLPLVLVLHGGFDDPAWIARSTGFHKLAAREDFIVVYPAARNGLWAVPRSLPLTGRDIAFMRALVDRIDAKHAPVDRAAVFAAGFSNGGAMALRLACEAPDLVAGVASVASAMPVSLAERCRPRWPVSVLVMHGTADIVSHYSGGILTAPGVPPVRMLSVRKTAGHFRRANRCTSEAASGRPGRTGGGPGGAVEVLSFERCLESRVELWKLRGASHDWPQKSIPFDPRAPNVRIDATREIWTFFSAVPRGRRRLATRTGARAFVAGILTDSGRD